MDYLNMLIVTLDPFLGPSLLFRFSWRFLINRASVEYKLLKELQILVISKQFNVWMCFFIY